MQKLEHFKSWLIRNNFSLSENSINKYKGAVNTVSNDMLRENVITKSLLDMSLWELDIALAKILLNPFFVKKNKTGNNMYSNALKQYRVYLLDIDEENTLENPLVEEILHGDLPVTQKERLIEARIGQGVFRKQLLEKYKYKCIITGIDNKKVLVASHIKPWAVSNNYERTDVNNGLLLSANLDRLFDCGLISFENSGVLLISQQVGKENEKRLNIAPKMQFDLKSSKEQKIYLEYHRDILFVK